LSGAIVDNDLKIAICSGCQSAALAFSDRLDGLNDGHELPRRRSCACTGILLVSLRRLRARLSGCHRRGNIASRKQAKCQNNKPAHQVSPTL
jgi:hypothetical protein